MKPLNLNEIRELVAVRLPGKYEPLQLTFLGRDARASGGDVIIGDDYGTELRVRLDDGAVYSVDPEQKLPTRLVNSSIEQLARFIEVFESHSRHRPNINYAQMQMELASIDPPAFANPENWWALINEQAQEGMPPRVVEPTVVTYASVTEPRKSTLGIAALLCALATPATWLGLYLVHLAGGEPGFVMAIVAVIIGFGAAIAGICLSIFSLRYEPRKAWAFVALPLCVLSFGVPCLMLGF